MSTHTVAKPSDASEKFAFSAANQSEVQKHLGKYPAGRQASAVMPLLTLAQAQIGGWLTVAAMNEVASILDMPPARVYEVASFYTMYRHAPVGKHVVEICTTTPCMLRGSDKIVAACERHLGIKLGENTSNGLFTLHEVECLGACVNAPMMQIGSDTYEDLTAETAIAVLDLLAAGKAPSPGPQSGRHSSEPMK
ncbi:MAG: NADH-quinone oxidoreductase subunit NuoE [Candidatus Symbiobacter sp.]|nr:NADH-quinone oxidoreductase subunit NuoE [Candidatus Symbiobacter sp.]